MLRVSQATGNAYRQRTAISFSSEDETRVLGCISHSALLKNIYEIPNPFFSIEQIFGLQAIFNVSVLLGMTRFIEMRIVLKSLKLKGLSPCL